MANLVETRLFKAIVYRGATTFQSLERRDLSPAMRGSLARAPRGRISAWGLPFLIRPVLVADEPVDISFSPFKARWFVFLHTTDTAGLDRDANDLIEASPGHGRLAEKVADYVLRYADGTRHRAGIKRRHQIGMFQRGWGENCFEAVPQAKPVAIAPHHERLPDQTSGVPWGFSQTRALQNDMGVWCNWLYALENPFPDKPVAGITFAPTDGLTPIIVSSVSAGSTRSHPLRWRSRRKALLRLPKGTEFDPRIARDGSLSQIQLDMGQVISATRRFCYDNETWPSGHNNQQARQSPSEIIVEYTAHPEADFHLWNGRRIAANKVTSESRIISLVAPAERRVRIRVVDSATGQPVAVKLHVHGEAGEYLAPTDRHRLPNPAWFEDYSADHVSRDPRYDGTHLCTYIPGETVIDLPVGRVYLEVSKGFEVAPRRQVVNIKPGTRNITVKVRKALHWRERGWVTADTHVHFLSPATAMLEGAAEGVNVINLLASQWGELMTNVGDFDGKTTFGSREAGGDGEFLVRVGTENRQHVLGHISLLGYSGGIITPMCTGGPDESAIGDPVGSLMTEWARQCRAQGGLVVFPHFPNPRAENAATLVCGDADAVEMTSWGDMYSGIDPYSLSDWYRYLNCGYLVPVVGGTDKMTASTAVGTIRTYARIPENQVFTYDAWMTAVRAGNTFVSYGPLMEMTVEGHAPGSVIRLSPSGGRLSVDFELASVTLPMTQVDLVVNGEVVDSMATAKWSKQGSFSVRVERSSWIALLVRGSQPGRREMIAAHSSPVMVEVGGSRQMSGPDASTILDQIQGALAYIDIVGTKAEDKRYRQMRMALTGAYRSLHNRLHAMGWWHDHPDARNHH